MSGQLPWAQQDMEASLSQQVFLFSTLSGELNPLHSTRGIQHSPWQNFRLNFLECLSMQMRYAQNLKPQPMKINPKKNPIQFSTVYIYIALDSPPKKVYVHKLFHWATSKRAVSLKSSEKFSRTWYELYPPQPLNPAINCWTSSLLTHLFWTSLLPPTGMQQCLDTLKEEAKNKTTGTIFVCSYFNIK